MILPHLPNGPFPVMVRTWSHTDRRHMLALVEALDHDVCRGILTPVGVPLSVDEAKRDGLLRARCLKGLPIVTEDLVYAAVSWSPRSPKKLRVESRYMALARDCNNWAEFVAEQCEDRGRRFYRLMFEGGSSHE